MRMNQSLVVFLLFLGAATAISIKAWSFASGAPPGFAGAYADNGNTCVQCHQGPPPTPVSGWITSNIPPSGYIPGSTYTITATATGAGHTTFGFEITPMDSSGWLMGSMTEQDLETEVIGGGFYITQTTAGNTGTGSKTWNFDWTAPGPGSGTVVFAGAFNITDADGTNSNDTIYTSTYIVQENTLTGMNDFPSDGDVSLFPNPASEQLSVRFTNSADKLCVLSIYDARGYKVIDRFHINLDLGSGEFNIPDYMKSGLYFITLTSGGRTVMKKLVLER